MATCAPWGIKTTGGVRSQTETGGVQEGRGWHPIFTQVCSRDKDGGWGVVVTFGSSNKKT